MPTNLPFHVACLKQDLAERKHRNARFSLRAYARYLGLDPSALSRMMSGKQQISDAVARRVLRGLTIDANQKRRFLLSILEQRHRQNSRALGAMISQDDLSPFATPKGELDESRLFSTDPERLPEIRQRTIDFLTELEDSADKENANSRPYHIQVRMTPSDL